MNSTTTIETRKAKDIEIDFDYAGSCSTSETGIASLEANLATDTDTDNDTDNNNNNNDDKKLNLQYLLRNRKQELNLSVQGVKQLHSELERLKQSETWYRVELQKNRNKQLHNLEKHYHQERQHVQENQRLQCECLRLCTKCDKLERELLTQRQSTLQQFKQQQQQHKNITATHGECEQFESLQQSALIAEQQLLIDVLRRQKRTLLLELHQLTEQKDKELLVMQSNMAHKELEQQRLLAVIDLQEQNVMALQARYRQQLQATAADNVEQVHQLSLDYHAAIMADTQQLKNLRKEFLQFELSVDQECQEEKSKAHQLIELNARYAQLCALYKVGRLELETQHEEHNKQQELEEKLQAYAREMKALNERINMLEHFQAQKDIRQSVGKVDKNAGFEENKNCQNELNTAVDEAEDLHDLYACSENLQKTIEKHREMFCIKDTLYAQLKDKRVEEETELTEYRAERLVFLQKLLSLQTNKVDIVQRAQTDWEIVQKQLLETERLTDDNARVLAAKCEELEHLNGLFTEQKVELQELHVQHMQLVAHETVEKKAADMQIAHLKQQLRESLEQQRRLQEDMSTDSAATLMQHRQQMRTFKRQVQQLLQVREEQEARLLNLERELKRHKRRALLIPEPMESCNVATAATTTIMPKNALSFDTQINDRLRILAKVLEAEHARHMQRYDLHIRSLLRHMKGLKKSLHAAEKKLHEQQSADSQQQALLHAQAQLQDMRCKYAQSQQTINILQQTLKKERREFAAKTSTSQLTVESSNTDSNLMDDMKNLIEQSAAATRRPSTHTVLQLIQRSEQCVPKLQKLEYAVGQLYSDVQSLLNVPKISNSLFDELQVASEIKCLPVPNLA